MPMGETKNIMAVCAEKGKERETKSEAMTMERPATRLFVNNLKLQRFILPLAVGCIRIRLLEKGGGGGGEVICKDSTRDISN